MRRVGIALFILLVAALVVYKVATPFTSAWVDIAFIGACVILLVLMRLVVKNAAPDESSQPPDKD